MLRWRLLLGTLLIALLVGLFWLDAWLSPPGILLLPLALVVSLLAANEYLGLLAARRLAPLAWLVYGGCALVVASNAIPLWTANPWLDPLAWPLGAFSAVVLAVMAAEVVRYRQPGGVMERLALAVLGVVYAGLLPSFWAQARLLGQGQLGIAALASLLVVVKLCDIGAYSVGRLLGRHKMSPYVSPGKTIEGGVGGLALACGGGWLSLEWLAPLLAPGYTPPPWAWMWYGLVVGLAGVWGDLAESLIKRDVGRKDSSHWMPGFGGVLDLVDSPLFAAPVAYFCWKLALS
jgi:phosphatidate cytidylyltransferase